MKSEILLMNLLNLLVLGIIIEIGLSAIFSITAMKAIDAKRVVQTTREAITFVASLFLCYLLDPARIFTGSGLAIPAVLDLVISALVISRFAGLFRDACERLRG